MADDNSTGHVFDEDLVEMNNPMPLWWVVLFVLTVVFAFVYVYAFPALGSARRQPRLDEHAASSRPTRHAPARDGAGLRRLRASCPPRR